MTLIYLGTLVRKLSPNQLWYHIRKQGTHKIHNTREKACLRQCEGFLCRECSSDFLMLKIPGVGNLMSFDYSYRVFAQSKWSLKWMVFWAIQRLIEWFILVDLRLLYIIQQINGECSWLNKLTRKWGISNAFWSTMVDRYRSWKCK